MITDKLVNKFLVFLYKEHISSYGESLSSLNKGGMLLLDKTFSDENPDAVVAIKDDSIKDLTFNLGKELESRGYAAVDNLSVFLTPAGYSEAKRLIHPYRHFFIAHWKWFVGTLFTFVTVLLAIFRFIGCK